MKQPTLPLLSRNMTRFSPRSRMRLGGLSGLGNSAAGRAGTQYWRISLPIGVPGPTRQSSSLSSWLSMFASVLVKSVNLSGIVADS